MLLTLLCSVLQVELWICGQLTLIPFLCYEFSHHHPIAHTIYTVLYAVESGPKGLIQTWAHSESCSAFAKASPLFCACLCVTAALWSTSCVVSQCSESQYQHPSWQAEGAAAIFGLLHGEWGSITWLFQVLYHFWGPQMKYLSLTECRDRGKEML